MAVAVAQDGGDDVDPLASESICWRRRRCRTIGVEVNPPAQERM